MLDTCTIQACVKHKYIKKGKKFLVFMEYVKEFEGQLQGAVADKNKEALQALWYPTDDKTDEHPGNWARSGHL